MNRTAAIVGSAIAGVLCIISGAKFIFDPVQLTSTQFVIAGLIFVLSGVILSSLQYSGSWIVAFVLIIAGIYFLARSAGIVDYSWLSALLGLAFWAAAGVFAYLLGHALLTKE